MPVKYTARLSEAQRDHLDRLTRTDTAHVRTIQHARALLLADASDDGPGTDERVADALGSARRRSPGPDDASSSRASTKRSA